MPDSRLPTRRQSVTGVDFDGRRLELKFSISKKLYRCPGCGASIPIGSEHVLVHITERDGTTYHQHWHRSCVEQVTRELRDVQGRRE